MGFVCSLVITNVYSFISTQQIFLPEQIYNKTSGAYKINTPNSCRTNPYTRGQLSPYEER